IIQSVCLSLPFHSLRSDNTRSGLSFDISFRLLATLLRTHISSSAFSLSRIGRIGAGSFLNNGNATAQGSLGRQPSDASLRTLGSLCLAHCSIWRIILSPYLMINGRTANSQVMNDVTRSIAATDSLK